MPIVYLSPSTQEYNPYVNTGNEEYWMNRLADAMEPVLDASGIRYDRNSPDMTAASSITASNAGRYDLHLALHSNASGQGTGGNRGVIAFYYPGSEWGRKAANILAEGLRDVYPLPGLVRAEASTVIGELRRTRAPAVLLELGFHDDPRDAEWIVSSIPALAENLVRSLTVYFGVPFFPSSSPWTGVVDTAGGVLNVRERPSPDAAVTARLYDGARVTVVNAWNGWDLIRFGDEYGYVSAAFIR